MVKIIVDCFGGDKSPEANVQGAVKALKRFDDLELILTGDEAIIKEELAKAKFESDRLRIVLAPEVVGCDEKPTDVIRLKKNSSLMAGIRMLREEDDISGFVSTGSSGAIVAAGMLRIGRLREIIRPAFCPLLPTMNGGIVGICDSGANIDVTPAHLQQFAIMGSRYLEMVYGIGNPKVGLLNVGVEAEKGDELRRETYQLLANTPGINFIGNMESRELLTGKFDLVVCDGFSGNVLIKATEGTSLELLKKIKKDIKSKLINKIGALFMYKMFMEQKEFMNYHNYGGSVLLGCRKVIVKGHGSSDSVAVDKCIKQAYKMETSGLNSAIEEQLLSLRADNTEA